MRIGVLGGTFNPIHCAHIRTALAAKSALSLDRVLLMVAASPHGSGVSFDLGRHLPFRIQQALRTRAVKSGLFYRVQPEALCPDCVHIDCLPRPVLQEGDSGVFVFWLQALLQSLCLYHDVCTGTFQSETRRAVLRFQRICCQPCTGVADERLWRALGR